MMALKQVRWAATVARSLGVAVLVALVIGAWGSPFLWLAGGAAFAYVLACGWLVRLQRAAGLLPPGGRRS